MHQQFPSLHPMLTEHWDASPTPLMAQKIMPCLIDVQNAKPMVIVPQMKQPIAVTVILS